MIKRYLLYLLRWQLSTPILAICISYFNRYGNFWATIIANFIGGLFFFWIDRLIFSKEVCDPIWEVKPKAVCCDCGKHARGYRLVYARNYDRRQDESPKYRCEECSKKKAELLKSDGVELD